MCNCSAMQMKVKNSKMWENSCSGSGRYLPYLKGVWKVMRWATERERERERAFLRACVQALVTNLFCSGGAERHCIYFKTEICERVSCEAWKKQWRDINRHYRMHGEKKQCAELKCFNGWSILNIETKGWFMTLEVGDQALLSQMCILIKLNNIWRRGMRLSLREYT